MAISTITAAGAFLIAIGAATFGSRLVGDSPETGASADATYALTTCVVRSDATAGANGDRFTAATLFNCSNAIPPANMPRGSWESLAQAFPR